MPVSSRNPVGQTRRVSAARLIARAFAFAALWAILGGGEGWAIGVPVIIVAVASTSSVLPAARWSVSGLARFIPYFLWNSLRGGVDVAARAVHPRLPIDPAIVRYALRLDAMPARVLMANTVTLLPGTLSARLHHDTLEVHVLNASADVTDMLGKLERRVADVFGQQLKARTR